MVVGLAQLASQMGYAGEPWRRWLAGGVSGGRDCESGHGVLDLQRGLRVQS